MEIGVVVAVLQLFLIAPAILIASYISYVSSYGSSEKILQETPYIRGKITTIISPLGILTVISSLLYLFLGLIFILKSSSWNIEEHWQLMFLITLFHSLTSILLLSLFFYIYRHQRLALLSPPKPPPDEEKEKVRGEEYRKIAADAFREMINDILKETQEKKTKKRRKRESEGKTKKKSSKK
ncbi:MAG: hypothetical protein GTO45_00115 [Candidatus Aminicenantes bacterium]|nr:hypothetical protein [Candidatus Aminicenantes bacterium]NIM77171.1 hypothetical protein [Candidatus Aminicenantes bacterium]NIN16464.1 hypothetical protein [Candidatus Aminicenantes bacterium]NIN40325.1 hypothetical protein [Candidatus Aminicenantes bacterium]NIN83144.1 hypothetical protein [Candidatus Aminicenantes bacterium]